VTFRDFSVDLLGLFLAVLGFAWAIFDAVNHTGRVGMGTLVGSLVLAVTGGFLISKHRTAELLDFFFAQAKRFLSLKLSLPSAGSDEEK
jgi:hypothetical protein